MTKTHRDFRDGLQLGKVIPDAIGEVARVVVLWVDDRSVTLKDLVSF